MTEHHRESFALFIDCQANSIGLHERRLGKRGRLAGEFLRRFRAPGRAYREQASGTSDRQPPPGGSVNDESHGAFLLSRQCQLLIAAQYIRLMLTVVECGCVGKALAPGESIGPY